MKSRLSESGSAHIVLVVVLIIALVGALGFIFWQNFIEKSSDTSSETRSSEPMDEKASEQKNLAFKEWGVAVPLQESDPDFQYRLEALDESDVVYIYFKDTTECVVGAISRIEKDKVIRVGVNGDDSMIGKTWSEFYKDSDDAITIDQYIYDFEPPQSGCADPEVQPELVDRQLNGTKAVEEGMTQLFKI